MKRFFTLSLLLLIVTGTVFADLLPQNTVVIDAIELTQGILNADYERKINNKFSYTIGTEVVGTLPTRKTGSASVTGGARFYPFSTATKGIFVGGKAYVGLINPLSTERKFFSWLVPAIGYNYVADNGFTANIGGDFIFPLTHYINTNDAFIKPVFRLKLGYSW